MSYKRGKKQTDIQQSCGETGEGWQMQQEYIKCKQSYFNGVQSYLEGNWTNVWKITRPGNQEKAGEEEERGKDEEMSFLRKLELLWITTLSCILYRDVWVNCQRIREECVAER